MSAERRSASAEERAGYVEQAGEIRLARVEALRALAALAVLTGHVWGSVHAYEAGASVGTFWRRIPYSGGFGVYLFYALSGYLLFWPFVRHHFGRGDRIDLRRYARNRALRILPLYFAAIVILLLVQNGGGTATLWWRHLLFVQAMWASSLEAVDGPLWSVSVEIQFYALLPLIALALAWASGRSRLRAGLILAIVGAASYEARQYLISHDSVLWTYQLPTSFTYFTAGMTVALLRDAWAAGRPRLLSGPAASASAWAAGAVGCWLLVVWKFDQQWLLALGAFLAVGALVLPLGRSRVVAALDWRPLAALGVASYSLYVWHVPILDAFGRHTGLLGRGFPLALAVVAAVCVAAAFGSYRVIEVPGLRLRRRWARGAAEQAADRHALAVPAETGLRA